MPYRNAPANMSPAPVRSFGSHGNAGTWRSSPPNRTNAPFGPSVTTAFGHHALELARTPPRRSRRRSRPSPRSALQNSRSACSSASRKASPKTCGDERLRAGERDLHAVRLRDLAAPRGSRPGRCPGWRRRSPRRTATRVAAIRSAVDVPGRQVARHGQAGPHRPLGVRGDDADAGAGRFADERRVAEVDAEFARTRSCRAGRSGRRRRSR